MSSYSTVLFDLDGTLIDSVRLILDSYHHTLATHGQPPRSDPDLLAGVGTPLRVHLRKYAGSESEMEAMIVTYRDYNLAHHDAAIRAYPGVVEMVRRLQGSGFRMGVVTSKLEAGARRGLRLVGLEDAMEVIVGPEHVTNPKPHPEPVLRAVALLGADPDSTMFVGDSLHDMFAGRAAGVSTAAVLWGPFDRMHLQPAAPDYFVATPAELERVIGPVSALNGE